jgi:hypothetical protein
MVNSRAKGKAGELEVVKLLNDNLGLELKCAFSRELSQTQEAGKADIKCSNPAWDFEIEVKRVASSGSIATWWRQVKTASRKSGRIPVLWYRYDRHDWQVVQELPDLLQCFWGRTNEFDDFNGELVTMTPAAFYKIALEQSAQTFFHSSHAQKAACHECGGAGVIVTEMADPMGFPFSVDIEETCRSCKGAGEIYSN